MMKLYDESLYWESDPSWYYFDEEKNNYFPTDDAPERAVKSLAKWKEEYGDDE